MADRTVASARRVLDFWLDEIGEAGWYAGGAAIDSRCRDFAPLWDEARDGAHGLWLTDAEGALAYLILTDQLPRNMFRGKPDSFATDPMARAAAAGAIDKGFDLATPLPQRQFFYLPLEHSEDPADQARAVALIGERMDSPASLLHARAHQAIIARFGRFPTRNAVLGRTDTAAESAWLAAGAYGAVVRALEQGRDPDFPSD